MDEGAVFMAHGSGPIVKVSLSEWKVAVIHPPASHPRL